MSSDGGIHAGHRQRMKERFLAGDLDGFSDHEVIEVLLFWAIPRRDTNELAHRLIERFGSFKAVFDADYDDIRTVEGIGDNAAMMIKFFVSSWRRYALADTEPTFVYDTVEKIGDYAVRLYVGVAVEKLYAMFFDNKMKLLDTVMISEGAVNAVQIPTRMIVEKAFKKNAASVVLIHNHPNGTPFPSEDDMRVSNRLRDLLFDVNIKMIDHVIVSGRFYRPVFENDPFEKQLASPLPFSYGASSDPEGVRAAELLAASDTGYMR